MWPFQNIYRERGSWRGWFKNDQVLELNWARHGWEFGAGVLVHSGDDDRGRRMLCLKFWRLSAFIPMGITSYECCVGEEPQWSIFGSGEFGLCFHWGHWQKSYDWPGTAYTLEYQQQMPDGSWASVFRREDQPYSETYPYTYVLKSGEVQKRSATVSKRRHILGRRGLSRLGWPTRIRESIDIAFDNEVGERSGSWKGGTVGCGYDLLPGETMLQSLRRMERDREFT